MKNVVSQMVEKLDAECMRDIRRSADSGEHQAQCEFEHPRKDSGTSSWDESHSKNVQLIGHFRPPLTFLEEM